MGKDTNLKMDLLREESAARQKAMTESIEVIRALSEVSKESSRAAGKRKRDS